ncbi:MAG TPA: 2-oxoglutarate dehydrogenase complex dihydrolipoyllysine-residue succinyltransferase [Terriglobia bacterium]|nr:2-oxoglutarate dehydrogenase complex dihydrolipoyllysine-residue succinyltransferase [Terriglobia bacterium]
MPEFGESISEATVARWLKRPGDLVAAGDAVVELETEKANVEVPTPHAGRLARIDKDAGEDVRVGEVLGIVEESQVLEAARSGRASPTGSIRTEDDKTTPGPRLAVVEKPAPTDGAGASGQPKRPLASPLAQRIAEEEHIDLHDVTGTGPAGRITKSDVEERMKRREAPGSEQIPYPEAPAPAPRKRPEAPPKSLPPPSGAALREERAPMSRRRRTIARRMLEAAQTTAMLTSFNEVNMSAVMAIRNRYREAFELRHQVSLGFTSFFVKAAIAALKGFPVLNAETDGQEIIYKRHYDIGVAIGDAEGLVVPVLKDADRMSFVEIEKAIKSFSRRAANKELSLEEIRGGTFTITNGGVFGSLLSTPILNPPETGILGLHKVEDRPVAINGEVRICPMMYLALTYDHRVVDGREAIQFLVRVKELIETPEALLLDL